MGIAYLAITAAVAILAVISGIGKIRRDPHQVTVVHDTVGVPLQYFPYLAACEFAGALGLAVGIWLPPLGAAAAAGLVLYFLGAVAAHLRAGDVKGLGPAAFMLTLAAGALVLRILTWRAG